MTKPPKPRKELLSLGRRGASVRVFLERGHALVRVQWTEDGAVAGTQSWPNTAANREAAKAFAEQFDADRRRGPVTQAAAPLTLRGLWEAYQLAEFPHLRPNSQRLYREYWRRWELFVGAAFIADAVTLEMVDQFRRELERRGLAQSTVRQTIRTAKLVHNWGDGRELVSRNRLARYRFKTPTGQRTESPAEYRRDEFVALLAQLDPERAGQWRAWVALALCGAQGRRQHSVLHLQWADIDLDAKTVIWRAAWDKLGHEETSPLRALSLRALSVAQAWRERTGNRGPWVLPTARFHSTSDTYTIQSLWAALRGAQDRAGIAHQTGRAGHGLRRMLAGDVNALTGDPMLALHAIGDRDARQATRYLKKRTDQIVGVFDRLDAAEAAEATTSEGPDDE